MRHVCAILALLLAARNVDAAAQARPAIDHVRGNVHVIDGAVDRIGVSAGPDGILLVDSGYPETARDVKSRIASLERGNARIVVNTHWHHTFGNAAFADARIIAHANAARRMTKGNLMFNRLIPPAPAGGVPDETFETSRSLTFNGERIDIHSFGPAHTDSDAIVIFHDSGVVFTGDLFVPHLPWIDFGSGGSVQGLLAAIDRLIKIVPKDAVLIPGHGRTSSYGDLIAYRDAVRRTATHVQRGIDSGISLSELQKHGLPANLQPWLGDGGIPVNLVIESFYKGLNVQRRGDHCEFVNGRWFDGNKFVRRAGFWSDGGMLTFKRPPSVECAVDLKDSYVIAPFAEAHTHKLGTKESLASDGAALLDSGIFYAMVQDPAHVLTDDLIASAADPEGVEAFYAQGVITSSSGVMPDFYRLMAERGLLGEGVTFEQARDRLFFTIDSREELQRKWPKIAALNDRFVKVILAFSDQYDLRRGNPRFDARPPQYSKKPGLDPDLLPQLVELAHRDGLKVSAHIETAADFRVAVGAGVDFIAHLPGAWQIGPETGIEGDRLDPWLLTPDDVREARERGTKIITTAYRPAADSGIKIHSAVHAHNLKVLTDARVQLMTGSDAFAATVVDELAFIDGLNAIDRARLLDIATRLTAQAMFPGRKIGELRDGFEANFLVYDENPLSPAFKFGKPMLKVKQGKILP